MKDFSIENEPILSYKKGSSERKELLEAIEKAKSTIEDIPIVIGGKEFRTKDVQYQAMPHNHEHKIGLLKLQFIRNLCSEMLLNILF